VITGLEPLAPGLVPVFEKILVAHETKVGAVTVFPLVIEFFLGLVRHMEALGIKPKRSELPLGGQEIRETVHIHDRVH